ncbi:MAG TPA: hypothetical protein VMD27_12120 [Candidatus Aquilonibacter sp.]|nr:hypothetical protein [Candidatus Aquilonibacter sp.]
MNDSTAFQIGQIAGVIMFLALFLGLCVFFVIALVNALTTRRKGWIIAAAVSSAPLFLLFIFFMVAFVVGFKKGLETSTEIATARRDEPSQFLTADMTPVSGNSIPYEISLPSLNAWERNDSHPQFDCFYSYRDAYVGVIAEGIGVGTPERICDISQKNLASKASQYSVTTPVPIQIDSQTWLTYDATATINGIQVKYRFYVYADSNYTIQIIMWTGPVLFDHYAPVFDRIAKSFKLPK